MYRLYSTVLYSIYILGGRFYDCFVRVPAVSCPRHRQDYHGPSKNNEDPSWWNVENVENVRPNV